MKDFWHLARLLLRERRLLILSVVFAFIGAGGLGAGLLGLAPVVDNILDPQKGRNLPVLVAELNGKIGGVIPTSWINALPTGKFDAVFWIVIALALVAVLGALCNFLHAYLSMTIIGRTVAKIRDDVFVHVTHMPLRAITTGGPSDFVSRVVYDTAQVGSGFSGILSKALSQVLKGAFAVMAAAIADWRLTLAALPLALVSGAFIRWTGKRVRRAARGGLEAFGELYHTSAEVLQHMRVVKTSTSEATEGTRFHTINMEALRQDMRVRSMRSLASPVVEVLALFVLGALTLVAVKLIMDGHLDRANFIIVLSSLAIAGASLKPLTSLQHDLQTSSAAAARIMDVLRQPREDEGTTKPAIARHRVSIRFEKVTFTYPGAELPSVVDVELAIKQGETVAFVGANGSGKTTLLSLIPRLFDPDDVPGGACGRVTIDDVDIRSVSLKSLREQIGVVTQETVMFKGSIRQNIAYGLPGAGDAQVADAARRARATDFIQNKPGGLAFQLGEQGSGLSGGQRQRIAIARAILRDPAILILDEATSMIDAESEAKISEALAEFARGRTCLIVAHRLSTVVHADRIVVMDKGRIVDVGKHADLLERCDAYRAIAQNQLFRHAEGPRVEGRGPSVNVAGPTSPSIPVER
jgi:subfamily B ATP-binding cassette protein MsbA